MPQVPLPPRPIYLHHPGGRGLCPYCMLTDIETVTSSPDKDSPRYRELVATDASRPLAGILCPECYLVMLEDEEREVPAPDDLASWRKRERLTQEQAARIAGVGRDHWSNLETGKKSIPQWLRDTLLLRWGSAP